MPSKQSPTPTIIHLDRRITEPTHEEEEHQHLPTYTALHQPLISTQPQQHTATILGLQHTLGNRAVQRLLTENAQQTKAEEDPNKLFDLALSNDLKQAEAPDKITLPRELQGGLKEGWGKSLPKGVAQEQGGIFVKTKDGSYNWRAGAPGTSKQFVANYEDKQEDETVASVGHTHPYSKEDGGHTNISFSDHDLAGLVNSTNPTITLRSGKGEFLVSRTQEFKKLIKGLDTKAKEALYKEIRKLHKDTYDATKGTEQARVEAAVKAICSKYHLVYYKGSKGKLRRQ